MTVILTIALLLNTPLHENLLKNASRYAEKLQQKCLSLIPTRTEQHNALESLVCGEKITDENLKKNLLKTSLIHIFIVSGSHLILFDELLSILKIPMLFRFLFLCGYSLGVGWEAPAVRALVGFVVKHFFKRHRFLFPPDLIVLITGAVTLILFPAWWNSSSLVMSWCAALALCVPRILRVKNAWSQTLVAQIAVFLFLCVPLWGLGSLHLLSILYNLILAPVIAYLLLPLSFLAVLFSPFLYLFEKVMHVFQFTLEFLTEPIALTKTDTLDISTLWYWLLCLQLLFHFLRLRLWQGKDVA
ncbi:MAG: ComEC/Rec2 family competence protein [Pseudobdellovibrionaceae bacterium]